MDDRDRQIFRDIFELYDKWRGTEIRTSDQWMKVTEEFYQLILKYPGSRLAMHLAIGIMDTFDDLYHDGNVPAVPGYFGRSDL